MSAFTCPWCGQTEPNDMLLRNNHWVKWGPLDRFEYDWCREHGMCIGQSLVLNHVYHDLRVGAPDEQLRRSLGIAEKKWAGRPTPPIITEARAELDRRERASRPRDPEPVAASEEVALW